MARLPTRPIRPTRLTRAASAAIGLCLAGCFYPGDRGRLLETKVDQLAANDTEIIKKLNETDAKVSGTLPKVEEKLVQMTKAMEGLDKASRRSDADIGVQLQKAVEDVQQLRGQVETYLHRIETLETGLKALQDSTDKRLGELADKEAAKQAEAKARADALKKPTTAREMLDLADQKAKEGDRPLARQLYAELLQKWPKDALAGQSEFGLAETYYADNKCEDALSHYGTVLKEHPKLPVVPDALLHASDCFRKLKMTDASRDALNELVRNHPKSEAAKTAKTKLAELEKAAPKKGGKK